MKAAFLVGQRAAALPIGLVMLALVSSAGCGQTQAPAAADQRTMNVTVTEQVDPFTFRVDAGPGKEPRDLSPSGILTLHADDHTVIGTAGGHGVFPTASSFRDVHLGSGTPLRVTFQLPAQSDGSYRLVAIAFEGR
jgi:hypothetical protein